MKKRSKVVISVSIDKKLSNLIKENMSNKSKYIEWLIYQDMRKNNANGIEKVII